MRDPLWNEENRKDFYRTLDEKDKKGELVDLIVRIEGQDKRGVKNALKPFLTDRDNEMDFFEYIPYGVIKTTSYFANLLAMVLVKEGFLLSANGLPLVSHIDISHIVSIPDLAEQFCSFEMRQLIRDYRKLYGNLDIQSEEEEPPSGKQWNLRNVQHYEAKDEWSVLGGNVKAAIIDTGCDYTHLEIRDRFNPNNLGYNFVDNNSNPKDGHSHGTHVAGSVAGERVGVAPNVRLYAVKVLGDNGYGTEADVIRGIEWCIRNEMNVANMSLGSAQSTRAEKEICDAALKYGVIIIAAAGNNYIGKWYPAAYDSVLSVAAVDREKRHAEFSNKDNTVDVAAPGVKVLSCIPGGRYAKYSGTSMASPHATGTMAGGLGLHQPSRKESEIEDIRHLFKSSCDPCESTGSPIMDSWLYGKGHVNVSKFMENVSEEY